MYVKGIELSDKILTMEVQCLNGHTGVRRIAESQIQQMVSEFMPKFFVCTECGLFMSLLGTETAGSRRYCVMLCPIHGVQKRNCPPELIPAVNEIASESTEADRSIVESFVCPQCSQTYAVTEIQSHGAFYQLAVKCARGHRDTHYIPASLDTSLMKRVLQRVVYCDRCLLPERIVDTENRGSEVRLMLTCPVHGITKKDISIDLLELLREAASEISEDSIVRAVLFSSDCSNMLALVQIDTDRTGYRLQCICPGNNIVLTRTLTFNWTDTVRQYITQSILTCEYCGLLTHMLDSKKRKNMIEFRLVCPVHGVLNRVVSSEVFEYVSETETTIDRLPSMIRSLSCKACRMPLAIRDIEDKRGLIELDMECQNGHREKRFFAPDTPREIMIELYKTMYSCQQCGGTLDFVYSQNEGRKSRVVLLCPVDGKYVFTVPHSEAVTIEAAYKEIQEERAQPPVEAQPQQVSMEIDRLPSEVTPSEDDVKVFRGCEIVGGKFDFKVKVKNESPFVITNVTVSIVAYPQDCMELAGESVKTISRIEVGGFRSPQFTLYPTKDCVQGKIMATVSYIDFRDQLHTIQVEPYLIRSVCDLLRPLSATTAEFEKIIESLEKTNQEQTLEWNPRVLFTKAEMILPTKNFHIIDTEEHTVGEEFIGTIRGFAQGKYTNKRVAVVLVITGPVNGHHALMKVEALGEDVAMLPTTVDELAEGLASWICLRCGGPLEPEQVEELERRVPVKCKYCSHTLTIGLYLQ